MNASKARDFFSAYYEGELSGGIKEAFERSLATDAELKLEYQDFCTTMKVLEEPEVDIEVPFDLHDKIMARLDHQAWETKQSTQVSLWGRWRLAFVGGVAVLALAAGVYSITNRQDGKVAEGGLGSISLPNNTPKLVESIDFTSVKGELQVQIKAKVGNQFSLKHVSDSSELAQLTGSGKLLTQSVVNDADTAQAFAIYDAGGAEKLLIVLPGKSQGNKLKGEGTVLDLAMAMADAFRTPMIVRANNRDEQLTWEFEAKDDATARASRLSEQHLNLSIREDGISVLSSF